MSYSFQQYVCFLYKIYEIHRAMSYRHVAASPIWTCMCLPDSLEIVSSRIFAGCPNVVDAWVFVLEFKIAASYL
jgi:hypothetical protein